MRWFSLAVACATLAACSPLPQLQKDIMALNGRPVREAFAIYGYPHDQKVIAGDTVYIWKNEFSPLADVDPCTFRLIAGPDGTIKTGDVNGSPRACRAFL